MRPNFEEDPENVPWGFPGSSPEDPHTGEGAVFRAGAELAGAEAAGLSRRDLSTARGQTFLSQSLPALSARVRRAGLQPAGSLGTCCWSGNSRLLITPVVICPGKIFHVYSKQPRFSQRSLAFKGVAWRL